ncbi:MAG: M48 family metalloprotease, partial [Acidobacteriaceae bacterium]|nr:M48 family metalloprotease [Acidobacteriaceae bacterium]
MNRAAVVLFAIILTGTSFAATPPPDSKTAYAQILSQVVAREDQFLTNIKSYSPLLETYIQNMKPDQELGSVPAGDQYFIGRLDMTKGVGEIAFTEDKGGFIHRLFGSFPGSAMKYAGAGFATITPDTRGVDTNIYDYIYIRREFLGEVRCLVFDLSPKKGSGQGRFQGRIWVEDQNYNIVRFNGTYAPRPRFGYYFHFDSWRLNMGPNLWLPAYIYSEESDLKYGFPPHHLSFKAQTRLWGYNVRNSNRQDELTEVLVEPAQNVKDKSDSGHDLGPVQSVRQWHAQAEGNVMERLERAGLVAPEGEVDRVLNTVVNNLEISNKLEVQPEIHCRVLLTAPLESFSVGHTIVLSRGLLDVIPDEATLAAVLAHEMGHILLTHGSN